MSKKTITIIIKGTNTDTALQLRYILADTIEARQVGTIINEGTGEGFTEVSFIADYSEQKKAEIKSLIQSLGLSDTTEIHIEETD